MPVDPKSTTPGVVPQSKPDNVVLMKCKSETCDSMSAVVVDISSDPHQRMYRCVKCHRSTGINVGGPFNFF